MKLINPLVILRILSTILFIESVSYLSCLPVAHIYDESPFPFLWSSVITITLSVTLYALSRNVVFEKVTNREGFLAVASSWVTMSAFGTLPFLFSGTIPSFIDAFFEASSGFSTTGSSILSDVEILPYSILFWRSLTHWIGGLGIIVLVIIILPSLRITGYQLLSLESSLKEKIHPRTKAVGFRLLFIYLGLTIAEIILLSLGEMDLFESICHTFGTVATGGFSTKNASIGYYSSYSQYIITLFMFLAGVSYVIYYYMVKLNFRKVGKNEELWFYLTTVIIAGAIVTGILYVNSSGPPELAFRQGFFQVISLLTTTGYSTTDYSVWPGSAILVIFLLFFTGASTGSTTGNIKMARHLLVIKNIRSVFIKIIHPNAVSQIKLNDRPVSEKTNISIISFIVLFIFIFFIGTIILVITGLDPITAASAAVASLGNIGPGLGSVGPALNYAHLHDFNKVFLSLLMIIGRLEIYTIFILFTRSFWKL
ncbi:MAG: TrkH family potassium uptake protein [Bacteroidales bacterium]|nr:TrkH family potassium uptake protein [Bacteroidales bacterium]